MKRGIRELGQERFLGTSGDRLQPALDQVADAFTGYPVEEVKPAIRQTFQQLNLPLGDNELDNFARTVSGGGRITIES